MIFLSTLIASVLLTAFTVPLLSRLALCLRLVDLPNERKVHQRPIPRVGGLAMALGMMAPVIYWIGNDSFVESYLAGAGVLILFGLLDDCYDLPPLLKLVGQSAAACIAVFSGGVRIASLGMLAPDGFLLPGWFAVCLAILVIVGVTNAINLSDGLDGLAGGISLLNLCCIGYLAYLEGRFSIGVIALALAGATFGFLRYNTYPASVFMGDVGSQLLGFSIITLALSLTQGNTPLSPLLPLVILGFPILDTLSVIVKRLAQGRSPFSADKTHLHHILIELGLNQAESVMIIYLIQVALIAAAFFLRFYSDWLLLIVYLAFSVSVLLAFRPRGNKWQMKRIKPLLWVEGFFERLSGTSLITYLFLPFQIGLIAVLLLTAYSNEKVPIYEALAALAAIAVLLFLSSFFTQLLDDGLKITLYLVIPLIIYQSAARLDGISAVFPLFVYHLSFGILALLNIIVARLTRRVHGFQSTPLDFLVLFIAFIAPQLLESNIPGCSLGIIAAKIIICYFSCEVLFAELRGNLKLMLLATLMLLVILGTRGIA